MQQSPAYTPLAATQVVAAAHHPPRSFLVYALRQHLRAPSAWDTLWPRHQEVFFDTTWCSQKKSDQRAELAYLLAVLPDLRISRCLKRTCVVLDASADRLSRPSRGSHYAGCQSQPTLFMEPRSRDWNRSPRIREHDGLTRLDNNTQTTWQIFVD